MGTDSLRKNDYFEEFIKYMFTDFLGGLRNAMTAVAEELRGFGERGTQPIYVTEIINHTLEL